MWRLTVVDKVAAGYASIPRKKCALCGINTMHGIDSYTHNFDQEILV